MRETDRGRGEENKTLRVRKQGRQIERDILLQSFLSLGIYGLRKALEGQPRRHVPQHY